MRITASPRDVPIRVLMFRVISAQDGGDGVVLAAAGDREDSLTWASFGPRGPLRRHHPALEVTAPAGDPQDVQSLPAAAGVSGHSGFLSERNRRLPRPRWQ